MGIDFSHCDAHWAYSGFHRFRVRLALEVGIILDSMAGFDSTPAKSWDDIEAKDDPIVPLLNHSDCDGVLSPEECRSIAPRLRELVRNWPAEDYDRYQAEMLAEGMDSAAEEGVALEFC
jgi:hypothetical protein